MTEATSRGELRKMAMRLADQLARFRTPGPSPDPVDPARLGVVVQAARRARTLEEVSAFVSAMPNSAMRKLSRAAGPQLEEIRKRVIPLIRQVQSTEELAYLLGWARRLLMVREAGIEV